MWSATGLADRFRRILCTVIGEGRVRGQERPEFGFMTFDMLG